MDENIKSILKLYKTLTDKDKFFLFVELDKLDLREHFHADRHQYHLTLTKKDDGKKLYDAYLSNRFYNERELNNFISELIGNKFCEHVRNINIKYEKRIDI
jgi:hypothetical protein